MVGIVFTTIEEAAPFVRRHTDGRIEALDEDAPIQTGNLVVAVTGRGKIKAALATERLLRAHDLEALLHVGSCAALSEEPSPGTVVGASFVLEGDRVELDAPTYPRMPLEHPFDGPAEGTLVSQDHTADDPDEQSYWERIADIRDDTGYAVAYVAAQHGTPCHVAKAVVGGPEQDGDTPPDAEAQAADILASFLQRVLAEKGELSSGSSS
jgi:nucleoside phosphorylase